MSSPVNADTPAAVVVTAADTAVAIDTLPNGKKPIGWTAFFNSFIYVESD